MLVQPCRRVLCVFYVSFVELQPLKATWVLDATPCACRRPRLQQRWPSLRQRWQLPRWRRAGRAHVLRYAPICKAATQPRPPVPASDPLW